MFFDGNELEELEGTPLIPPLCGKILQTVFDTLTSVTSGKYWDLRRLMVPSISPLKASIMKFYSKYCGCKHTPSRKKSDILNQSVLKWNWTQKKSLSLSKSKAKF